MKIQGNLATYEFSDLLQWLAQGNKTGVLTVSDGEVEYQLGFEHGRIDMSSSSDPSQRLETYLHNKGVVDRATLERAERLREATSMMSGQVLVTLGAITETQLAQVLREKTEKILCELLTWDEGTFEFEGGERPAATMVPISLEVTKLLLESMHRLDQRRGAPPEPPAPQPVEPQPETTLVVDDPGPATSLAPPADATQAIEGLALAEVLDPESLPQGAPEDDSEPVEVPANFAAMAESPGALRRYAPYALVAVLSLSAVVYYLVDRGTSAQAADATPSGEPILFSHTEWPPRPATPPAAEPEAAIEAAIEATVQAAAEAPQPAASAGSGDSEEALRRRYEEELATLRRELEEARRLGQPAPRAAQTLSPRPGDQLPADSLMRAAVSRSEPVPAAPAQAPAAAQPPPSQPTAAVRRAPVEAELAVAKPPPAAPRPTAISEPEPAAARLPRQLELVNPKLLSRPTPRYPEAARRHGRGADVTLRVLVGPDGRVQEVERVGAKAGMGFDRAAENAARDSLWQSGTRDGEPVAMWAELRFEFKP